jgi:cobaltochelatase CobN
MMEHDYAGARAMDHGFIENLWGWTVVTPDMITDSMWNQVYDIYVQDSYDLGLKDWFNEVNPWARQSITARMLEVSRKDYWDAPETIAAELAKQYMEAVVEYGVTCCHHTCNNLLLNEYMKGLMDVADVPIDQRLYEKFLTEMAEARGVEHEKVPEAAEPHHRGGGGRTSRITEEEPGEGITNVTETTGVSKTGEELKKPPETAADEKKGKVLKEETREKQSPKFPVSGAPLMGIIAVIVVLVLIGIGMGRKRRRT